jgi:hypothetical protein
LPCVEICAAEPASRLRLRATRRDGREIFGGRVVVV